MALVSLSTQEQIDLCKTINSYSTILSWMISMPFVTDDRDFTRYLPQTNDMLGYAVIPIMIKSNKEFIKGLKYRFGSDPNIMSFLNTQDSLANEEGDELKVEWALRVFKEKKLFGITFKVQSNLIPSYGNTGINLGIYNGKHVALPIHDMFSDMNFGKISNEEAGGLDNSKLSRTNEAKTIKDKQNRNILERWEKFKSNSQ